MWASKHCRWLSVKIWWCHKTQSISLLKCTTFSTTQAMICNFTIKTTNLQLQCLKNFTPKKMQSQMTRSFRPNLKLSRKQPQKTPLIGKWKNLQKANQRSRRKKVPSIQARNQQNWPERLEWPRIPLCLQLPKFRGNLNKSMKIWFKVKIERRSKMLAFCSKKCYPKVIAASCLTIYMSMG